MPNSSSDTDSNRPKKLEETLHAIRTGVMLEDERMQQKAYRARVHHGYKAMAEAAEFPMDDDLDVESHFIIAAEGSTVNVGNDQDKPQSPPAQAPQVPVQLPARNGSTWKTVAVALGASAVTVLLVILGGLLLGERDQPAAKPEPPATIQPADPPETGFRIR